MSCYNHSRTPSVLVREHTKSNVNGINDKQDFYELFFVLMVMLFCEEMSLMVELFQVDISLQ